VTVWNAETGQETLALKGHVNDVVSVVFSPDGTRLASATEGGTLKLWDAVTGQDTLTLMGHVGRVTTVAFSRDGKRIVSAGWDGTVKVWDARPLANEPAFFEFAYSRTLIESVQIDRAESDIIRLHSEEAPADVLESARLRPEAYMARYFYILSLLDIGDREGLSRECSELIEWFRETTDPSVANSVAWSCVLAPNAVVDAEAPVRLAENAVKNTDEADQKPSFLNTLGASLYRAGRFEVAILRIEDAINHRHGAEEPLDWPFLAMAHHRLGHREVARRWLNRLRAREPIADPDEFWNELEIRLLRSEAEAVVLYDPIFPVNPFAP
jgi:tetratricopeptide (TPR) repeat protein